MDRPFRLRNVHLSAPHMYSTVIEALQLSRSSNLSFLNIGSGSGYLTCLVACLIGRGGLCHGIERNEEVTEQAILTTHQWWHVMLKDDCNPFHLPHIRNISYATGNACLLAPPTSTTGMRYDRIYIGAGCSEHVWQFFRKHFLNPNNGIMVLPNDDNNNLIAIHATGTAVGNDDFSYKVVSLSSVCFNPLMDVEVLDARERLKPISFSSGLSWSTDTHRWFPTHFRVCVERVFLCGRMKGPDPLPREVLFYILSFVRR